MMNSVNTSERPLAVLTDRQRELMRLIQSLPGESRHTLTIVLRGTEPWEVQTLIEHKKLGEFKPRA